MAKFLTLRWTKVKAESDDRLQSFYYESNLVKVTGPTLLQIDASEDTGIDISYLRSLTGDKFDTFYHDYFGKIHITPEPFFGIGQIVKFRINKLPILGTIIGEEVQDAGDVNQDNPNDILNGFAGSEGTYFLSTDGEIFAGKNQ